MKLMRRKHVVYCLLGIPLLSFALFILLDYFLPEDSMFLDWVLFIGWVFRLLSAVGAILCAYYTYRFLEDKYNLFLLPFCILLSCIVLYTMVALTVGYGTLSWLWFLESVFFSLPAFGLTLIIAIPFELEKFFKRK